MFCESVSRPCAIGRLADPRSFRSNDQRGLRTRPPASDSRRPSHLGAWMIEDAPPAGSEALHRAAVFTIWPETVAGADPARHRIWAYCDKLSYAPGDLVRVHAYCSAPHFDLEI